MTQNIKYIIGFILLLAIGYGALQWVRDYQYKHSAEYAASRYYDELQQRYQNDTYGGSTPEETLSLFIDALKKGDVELASKYFEVKKQDEKLTDLKIGKENGSIEKILTVIQRAKSLSKYSDGSYDISVVEKDNSINFSIHFTQNKITKKWKIESL